MHMSVCVWYSWERGFSVFLCPPVCLFQFIFIFHYTSPPHPPTPPLPWVVFSFTICWKSVLVQRSASSCTSKCVYIHLRTLSLCAILSLFSCARSHWCRHESSMKVSFFFLFFFFFLFLPLPLLLFSYYFSIYSLTKQKANTTKTAKTI